MTLKQNIETEAAKAGAAIRAALQEFAEATGMQAQVSVDWIVVNHLSKASTDNRVGRVALEVGGLTVEA